MKLQCLGCKKTFLYPAKLWRPTTIYTYTDQLLASPLIPKISDTYTTETHVCPFCQSLEFEELHEPQAPVESAIQVEWNLVDTYLQQGYEIADRYAKVATMLKYKKEEEREVKEK